MKQYNVFSIDRDDAFDWACNNMEGNLEAHHPSFWDMMAERCAHYLGDSIENGIMGDFFSEYDACMASAYDYALSNWGK